MIAFRQTTREQMLAKYGERYRWYVVLTVMVGMMAAIISSTIVNVAVPDMSRVFALDQSRAQWIAAAFMMAMTLALPVTPSLLSRFGLLRTYFCALALLMVGGILGGLAPNYELMIAARVIEGLAAGVIQPVPNIVILRSFKASEQGRAMGIFGLGVVLAPALGPAFGGLLVEGLGWRSIFFFVVPVCLLSMWLSTRFIASESSFPVAKTRFNWMGLSLLAVLLMLLQNGMVNLGNMRMLAIAMIGSGLVLAVLFVRYQWSLPEPLVQVRLFVYRHFAMGILVAFVYGIGLFGSTYLLPVYLQMGLGYSPSAAGAALIPAGLILAVTVFFAGRLADRFEPARIVAIGVLLLTSSMILMAAVGNTGDFVTIVLCIMLGRVGLGLVLPALTLGLARGLERDQIAQAASMQGLMRQLGGALGISLVGFLIDWRLRAWGLDAKTLWMVSAQGVSAVPEGKSIVEPFSETFLILAAITIPAAAAALFMTPRQRANEPP